MMMPGNEFNGREEGLVAFNKVLVDPQGQAVIIVGPPMSGRSALLTQMLEKATEYHSYDVERAVVESVAISPDQDVRAMLITLSGNQSRGHPITDVDEYLRLLHALARQIGEKQRLVIAIDAHRGLPPSSRSVWLQIIQGLPQRVKMIVTQPLDDVLSNGREFTSLPNVKWIWLSGSSTAQSAENTTRRRQRSKRSKQSGAADSADRFWRVHKHLTRASKEILEKAASLAREQSNGHMPLTTSCLLFAMIDSGRSSEDGHDTPKFLLDFLERRVLPNLLNGLRERYFRANLNAAYPWSGVPCGNLGDVTTFVIDVLEQAVGFARRTTQGDETDVRHLLSALMLFRPEQYETGARNLLRRMGVDGLILRTFVEHLRLFEKDNQKSWADILRAGRGELLPVPLALLNNDGLRDAAGKLVDRLDMENEVNAFCTVITAWKAQPPISIGLFGDWGSGKSFFMDMMYDRINEIQGWAKTRAAAHEDEDPDFCTDVVQIRFNAWHYVDQNLWAGLVTHIFDELAAAVSKRTEDTLERAKEQLLRNTEIAGAQLREARAEEQQAVALKEKSEAILNALTERRRTASADLATIKGRDVIILAKEDPRVKANLLEVANRLGVSGNDVAIDEIRAVVQDSRRLFGQVGRLWKDITSQKKGRWRRLLLTSVLTVGPVIIGYVLFKQFPDDWWRKLGGVMTTAGIFVAEVLALVRPRLKMISAGLDKWEETQEQIQAVAAEKSREEMRLEEAVRKLQDQENEARKKVMEAELRFQKARSELDEIRTGRRLYRFIEERSRRTEYKSQLGIISLIRRDFEGLQKLVGECARSPLEMRDNEQTSKGTGAQTNERELRIDRIVLYIDDLDRCPARRVVEVLQAVHLLLAFKLFVVVVGVDPRWILHALREEYAAFGADQIAANLHHRWLTTPQNYVEKIFQIPFALRPIEDDGYRNLVRSLLVAEGPKTREPAETTPEGAADGDKQAGDTPDLPRQVNITSGNPVLPGEQGDTAHPVTGPTTGTPPPKGLRITQREIDFMSELGFFVQSPRATKRLVNVYRLIRATIRTDQELARFEGRGETSGEYEAVLLMLALLTRFPDPACRILSALASNPADVGTCEEFLGALKTKTSESEPSTYYNIISTGMSKAEATTWDNLSDVVASECGRLRISNSLVPFVHWADCVARFSFQYTGSWDRAVK